MIDVCLLGTGGVIPLPNRWLTALLVRYNGKMILFDCGEGTQIPLKLAGWGLKNIDAICFTHYHGDHIAGLPGLLLTMGNSGREDPLLLMGPHGLEKVVAGLTVISPQLPFEIKLHELSHQALSQTCINELQIKSIPVEHSIPCLSYCVELKRQGRFDAARAKELDIPIKHWKDLQRGESVMVEGKMILSEMVLGEQRKGIKVCYCTDTRPTEALADFISASDLFICEGMYGDEVDLSKAISKNHMTFSEAAALAGQGNVKELWLTHYSPALTEPEQYLEPTKAIFPHVLAGQDLMMKTMLFEA